MTKNSGNDENFQKAMDIVFKNEGGYSDNKYDKGGRTNMGITQNTYNDYCKRHGLAKKDVKNLTKPEAVQIYYDDYWKASGADTIDDFALALVLFDSAVNHGVGTAKNLYKKSCGNVYKFLNLRREKYKNIVEKNPSQKIFYKGWTNRIDNLEKYISNIQDNVC